MQVLPARLGQLSWQALHGAASPPPHPENACPCPGEGGPQQRRGKQLTAREGHMGGVALISGRTGEGAGGRGPIRRRQ